MQTCPHHHARWRRQGFTLVETLVVIAILATTLALLLPAVQKVRGAAARASCSSNLRQLALAVHVYSDTHDRLPKGCDYPFRDSEFYLERQPGLSWHTSILPYVEQDNLWRMSWEAHREAPAGNSVRHDWIEEQVVPVFLCPSESARTGSFGTPRRWGLTSYQGLAGTHHGRNDGLFHRDYSVRMLQITDGTSSTLLIGERPPGPQVRYGGWYGHWGGSTCQIAQILPAGRNVWIVSGAVDCKPETAPLRPGKPDDACHLTHFWSLHSGGAHFAFADGSVRFLAYSRSPLLRDLATRAGGEVVSID